MKKVLTILLVLFGCLHIATAQSDACATATPITPTAANADCTDTTQYSIEGLTTDAATDASCTAWFEATVTNSGWFVFTAPTPLPNGVTTYTFSTEGDPNADDTQLNIFSGDCGNLVSVACNDDISSTNYNSSATWEAVAGTTYYIMVDGYDNNAANFTICLKEGVTIGCDAISVGTPIPDVPQTITGCPGDTISFGFNTDAVVPNTNGYVQWYVNTGAAPTLADVISGAANDAPNFLGAYPSSTSNTGIIRTLLNSPFVAGTTYYLTGIISGMHNDGGTTAYADDSFGEGCTQILTYTITILPANDPACGGGQPCASTLNSAQSSALNYCEGESISVTIDGTIGAGEEWLVGFAVATGPTVATNLDAAGIATFSQGWAATALPYIDGYSPTIDGNTLTFPAFASGIWGGDVTCEPFQITYYIAPVNSPLSSYSMDEPCNEQVKPITVNLYPLPKLDTSFIVSPQSTCAALVENCANLDITYSANPNGTFANFPSNPQNGIMYYQVKVVGAPETCVTFGEYTLSGCTNSLRDEIGFALGLISPNPTTGDVNVEFNTKKSASVNYNVTDILGRVVLNGKQDFFAGRNILKLNISDYTNGMYMLNMFNGSDQLSSKIIKQ